MCGDPDCDAMSQPSSLSDMAAWLLRTYTLLPRFPCNSGKSLGQEGGYETTSGIKGKKKRLQHDFFKHVFPSTALTVPPDYQPKFASVRALPGELKPLGFDVVLDLTC